MHETYLIQKNHEIFHDTDYLQIAQLRMEKRLQVHLFGQALLEFQIKLSLKFFEAKFNQLIPIKS